MIDKIASLGAIIAVAGLDIFLVGGLIVLVAVLGSAWAAKRR